MLDRVVGDGWPLRIGVLGFVPPQTVVVAAESDRVVAMNQGQVLAMGSPREVQTDPAVVEAYLGTVDDVSSLRRAA